MMKTLPQIRDFCVQFSRTTTPTHPPAPSPKRGEGEHPVAAQSVDSELEQFPTWSSNAWAVVCQGI